MAKNPYFNFYSVYLNELNKLNPFQFKKVVNAISVYAETDELPMKLSNRGLAVFNKIQTVILAERQKDMLSQIRSDAGKKGSQNRWKWQKHNKSIAKTWQKNSKSEEGKL